MLRLNVAACDVLPCSALPCVLRAASSYKEGWGHTINSGDVEGAFASGDIECVVEGEAKMGGQVRARGRHDLHGRYCLHASGWEAGC